MDKVIDWSWLIDCYGPIDWNWLIDIIWLIDYLGLKSPGAEVELGLRGLRLISWFWYEEQGLRRGFIRPLASKQISKDKIK